MSPRGWWALVSAWPSPGWRRASFPPRRRSAAWLRARGSRLASSDRRSLARMLRWSPLSFRWPFCVGTASPVLLRAGALPLGAGAAMALLLAVVQTLGAGRSGEAGEVKGRAFNLRLALDSPCSSRESTSAAARAQRWLGPSGVVTTTALAGFADVHAPSAAIASLVASGEVSTPTGAARDARGVHRQHPDESRARMAGGYHCLSQTSPLWSRAGTRSGVGWVRNAAANGVTGSRSVEGPDRSQTARRLVAAAE